MNRSHLFLLWSAVVIAATTLTGCPIDALRDGIGAPCSINADPCPTDHVCHVDDGATDVLVSGTDDATEREIRGAIASLNDDERADLLALLYVGRGDMEPEEWGEAVRFAREREAVGEGAAHELLGIPNASDLLEEGLDRLGITTDLPQA